jgi:hypothetical protein
VAAAVRLLDRGHDLLFVGDRSVARSLEPLGVSVNVSQG